jgi:threonine-phosphate decarboxylase
MEITHGGRIFAVARELGCDWRDISDFSANINPLGPAPGVRNAIINAIDEIVHYPDPHGVLLRRALAEEWGVDEDCILIGNGATELIFFLSRVCDDSVSLATPVFSEFHRAFLNASQIGVNDSWPDEGLLVYTNPINPTGEGVASRVRKGLTLVDESFLEFTDLPSCIGKTLVLRSLTKFHALPGLRVGALVGPAQLISRWRQYREPWQLNILAQAAALASIGDKDHQKKTRAYVMAERERVIKEFDTDESTVVGQPLANYFLVQFSPTAFDLVRGEFLKKRILVRDCTGWAGVPDRCLRFAIRTREQNDRLLTCWRQILCATCTLSL